MLRHALVFVALAVAAGFAGYSGLAGAATELVKQVSLVFAIVSVAMLALYVHDRLARTVGKAPPGRERRRVVRAESGT
jgi:uncharacterized membrane protein YtjA (UPF0391 family)